MFGKKKQNKHPEWQLTGNERGWYYIGDTARQMAAVIVSSFMTVFLLFQGINTTAVATSIFIVKIIDALDDVLFGFLVDRLDPTKWKWTQKLAGKGKYMPWYRLTYWTFPAATIFFYLMPRGMSNPLKILWFTVFYLLYDLTCTLSEVPMNTMVVTLTENPEERNHILTIKGVILVIAGVLVGVVAQFLISEAVGLSITTVTVSASLIFFVLMTPMCFKVNEHNTELKNAPDEEETKNYSFKDMLQCVLTNKYIFIFFLSVVISSCLQTGTAMGTLTGFYIFHDSNIYSYIMLIGFVPGIVLSFMCGKVAGRIGKKSFLVLILFVEAGLQLLQYSLRGVSIWTFIIIGSACAIPNAFYSIVQNYIAPDTVEYTRYKTGKDCSGIFFSLKSFITKATAGIASSLGLFILGVSGWQEVQAESFAELAELGVTQTAHALDALWSCSYLIPGIGYIVAGIVMLFYNLKDKDAELMAKCNAGTITREECEAGLSRKY